MGRTMCAFYVRRWAISKNLETEVNMGDARNGVPGSHIFRNPIPEETWQRIEKLRANGMSLTALAKRFGKSHETIRQGLRRRKAR
jgi:DNA invertase Pin-like site-specific DNA recombinase